MKLRGGNDMEEREKLNAREQEDGLGHAHNMHVSVLIKTR